MDSKETLNFKVTLGAKFWNKLPEFSIYINDTLKSHGTIDPSGHSLISFDHELSTGQNELKIKLHNKEDTDTVVENGEIVKDMLLNIEEVVIDEVPMGNLLRNSVYQFDQPHEYQGKIINSLDSCLNLGWNGTYVLTFSSPFYMWLLENL